MMTMIVIIFLIVFMIIFMMVMKMATTTHDDIDEDEDEDEDEDQDEKDDRTLMKTVTASRLTHLTRPLPSLASCRAIPVEVKAPQVQSLF